MMRNGGYLATRIGLLTFTANNCSKEASPPPPPGVPGRNHYSVSPDHLRSLLSSRNTEKSQETSAYPKF